jgi:SAM-dependent methyltransferase
MAQKLTRDFVRDLDLLMEFPEPIVEFGSMQVEPGQEGDLRPIFPGRTFIGTDMREGPGVDRVENLLALGFDDGEVGTAVCLDTLEHCRDPVTACREMYRVTANGGICVIASVMLFGIHAYPNDYFRFTPEGFRSMLAPFDDVDATGIGDPRIPMQILGVGAKGRQIGLSLDQLPSVVEAQGLWDDPGQVRVDTLRYRPGAIAKLVARELARVAGARMRGFVRR